MENYESKQKQINRPAADIFKTICRFDYFTPIIGDKVEDWTADEDSCSFKVKGFTIRLRISERDEYKHIKIEGEGVPANFAFWIQLKEVDPTDTRIRVVLQVELNMMMRMMVGGKLQDAVDQIAEGVAKVFNRE